MIKVAFCILIVFFCTTIGTIATKRLKSKETLFFDFVAFCNDYEANLDFFQKELEVFVKEFSYTASTEFKIIMNNAGFIEYYDENSNNNVLLKLKNSLPILSFEESKYVNDCLVMLGKGDSLSQKRQLATYKYYFLKQFECSKQACQTKGKIYTRLGLLMGIFLAILVV